MARKTAENSTTEVNVTETGVSVVDTSKMTKAQKELLAKTIRKMQNGGEVRKGRAVDPESKRQKEIAAKNEKRAAGLLKKGRPAFTPEQKAEAEKAKEAKRQAEIAQMEALASQLIESGDAEAILNAAQ